MHTHACVRAHTRTHTHNWPVRVDIGLLSDMPLSGVVALVSVLDDKEDTLVNVCSVWLPACIGKDAGWWRTPPLAESSGCGGGGAPGWCWCPWRRSVEARRSPSNRPSRIMRSFWATSGGGGGGLSSPPEAVSMGMVMEMLSAPEETGGDMTMTGEGS